MLELIEPRTDASAAIASAALGIPSAECESHWLHADGSSVVVAWTATPIADPSGRNRTLCALRHGRHRAQAPGAGAPRVAARIVAAADEERRRLERNLHDGAQQRLVSLSLALRLALRGRHRPAAAAEILGASSEELAHALEELRELARGIHPAVLTDRGLNAALESLAARAPFPVELRRSTPLPEPIEAAAYYVVSESIANVVKHAHRDGRRVGLDARERRRSLIEVADDGVGGAEAGGSGLRGLADRRRGTRRPAASREPAGRRHAGRAEIPLAHAGVVGSSARPMRVVLADDSVLLREGIARLLEDAGFEVVGQAGTARSCCSRCAPTRPTSRSSTSGCRRPTPTRACGPRSEIREKHPETGVLVLSQYVEPDYALELLAESAEGVGYLLKDRVADVDEFAAAVRRVGEGGSALDPRSSRSSSAGAGRDDPLDELTPREREVLELMAEGRSNQAICRAPGRHRARGREARDEHLREAPPAGRRRATTAACSPCSRSCARLGPRARPVRHGTAEGRVESRPRRSAAALTWSPAEAARWLTQPRPVQAGRGSTRGCRPCPCAPSVERAEVGLPHRDACAAASQRAAVRGSECQLKHTTRRRAETCHL